MACLSGHIVTPSSSRTGVTAGSRRAGSFVMEAIIAVLLLATASLAVVRLARSAVDLQLRADRELAAALTAQNVLAHLEAIASDQLPDRIAEVERSFGQRSGCDVEIAIRPFDRQGIAGLHLAVEVTAGNQARVELHDWRLERRGSGEQRDDGVRDE